jgi:hypothetical protein
VQAVIYPANGQSPEQQAKDESECYAWAKQQSGFDPAQAAAPAPAPAPTQPSGARVRGAAGGAIPTSRIRLIENANILIVMNLRPKGLHYTGVAVSSSVAVILGGG